MEDHKTRVDFWITGEEDARPPMELLIIPAKGDEVILGLKSYRVIGRQWHILGLATPICTVFLDETK